MFIYRLLLLSHRTTTAAGAGAGDGGGRGDGTLRWWCCRGSSVCVYGKCIRFANMYHYLRLLLLLSMVGSGVETSILSYIRICPVN